MDMAGAAVAGLVLLGAVYLWAMIVTVMVVSLMIVFGVIDIRMRVGLFGRNLSAGQHELFLRRCRTWRNLVA